MDAMDATRDLPPASAAPEIDQRNAAEQCAALGLEALRAGSSAKAARLLAKAVRLHPGLPQSVHEALRRSLEADAGGGASPSGSTASPSVSTAGGSPAASGDGTPRARPAGGAGTPAGSAPDGARFRGATGGAAAPASGARPRTAAGGGGAATPSAAAAAARPYTQEQADLVRKLRATRDHYELFGIARDGDEEAVKRAYRKLALKVHPDKNGAPGAEAMFKRVGQAYATLSDPDRRAEYDRYGEQGATGTGVGAGDAGGGGGFGGMRGGGGFHGGHQVDPDEIFRAFFGGGFPGMAMNMAGGGGGMRGGFVPGGGFRVHRQAPQRGGGVDADGAQRAQFMQLLPIIVFLLFSLYSMGGNNAADRHFSLSLSPAEGYSDRRVTRGGSRNIIPGLPYYVRRDFNSLAAGGSYFLQSVEREVHRESHILFERQCRNELLSSLYASRIYNSPSSLSVLKQLPTDAIKGMPNCVNLNKYFGEDP